MTPAPHPLSIRTRLMCALLGAGHDVPTAQRMMMEAVAAIHHDLAPWFEPAQEESTSKDFPAPPPAEGAKPPLKGGETAPLPAPEPKRGGRTPATRKIETLDTASMTLPEIAAALDISYTSAAQLCKRLRKLYKMRRRRGWLAEATPAAPIERQERKASSTEPQRRFTTHAPLNPEAVRPLEDDHPAVVEGRTLFPSTVVDPDDAPRILVSGKNSRKIGDRVTKGPWSGMPIFVLTLEERATCPRECHHWGSCMGNGMPMARRHRHGLELEMRLERDLAALDKLYPQGFVVRLHQLGDFYSLAYVERWLEWLLAYPALHCFGYTAHPRDSEIGGAIDSMTAIYWDRFAIRFSSAEPQAQGATTIWRLPEGPTVPEGIVCPAQTDATACCGTCGLCWAEPARDKTIVFVAHGNPKVGRPPAPADPAINERARGPWPAEFRDEPKPETGDPVPETRRRFDEARTRRCDCGTVFKTAIVDETMCPACIENARRHREMQAGRAST